MKNLNAISKSLIVGLAIISSTMSSADTFTLDPSHTNALFRVMHMGINPVYGRFNTISGSFDADAQGNLTSVSINILATSIDTQIARRDTDLRSPTFFHVASFPNLSFVSSSVQSVSDTEFDVTGQFTMRGVAKTITIRVNRTGLVDVPNPNGGLHIGAESVFTIKRSDFGMTAMAGAIGDEIRVIFSTDGLRR